MQRFLSIGKKANTERLKCECQIQVLRNTPTHTTAQLDLIKHEIRAANRKVDKQGMVSAHMGVILRGLHAN